jgi:hypothetical protein
MANRQKGPQRGPVPRTGYANYTTVEEIPMGEEVLAGTFFLNEQPVIILSHLLIHIVHEIKYLGHMFLHQMYPFERFMTVLKKCVHNRSCPEGCMVQG